MFNRRNVEQMISAWAPESDSIISAGLMQSHEEKVPSFRIPTTVTLKR
jgi:hypothetical protein